MYCALLTEVGTSAAGPRLPIARRSAAVFFRFLDSQKHIRFSFFAKTLALLLIQNEHYIFNIQLILAKEGQSLRTKLSLLAH